MLIWGASEKAGEKLNAQLDLHLAPWDVNAFISFLVLSRKVSGSPQRQALNAIVSLYKQVLNINPGNLGYLRNVKVFKNVPTVLSADGLRKDCDRI
jgi:hypothetical protein